MRHPPRCSLRIVSTDQGFYWGNTHIIYTVTESVDSITFLDIRFASFTHLFNNTGNIAPCEKLN